MIMNADSRLKCYSYRHGFDVYGAIREHRPMPLPGKYIGVNRTKQPYLLPVLQVLLHHTLKTAARIIYQAPDQKIDFYIID